VVDVSVVNMLVASLVVETTGGVDVAFPSFVEILLSLVTISVEKMLLKVVDVSVVILIVVFIVA